MATKTSTQSGLWSAGATWVGGLVPADGDTVVIASGHTVEFDVNQSTWVTGLAGISVTGTLKLTRTPGNYYMMVKASTTISGAGVFDCGVSGDAIPFTAKHIITGGNGWYINGSSGLTMTVYGAAPTYKTALTTQALSAGNTRIYIDTNVSGDIWTIGDTIRIDNTNKTPDSEARVISAIAATYIDISAGLTASKIIGSVVSLITRNIRFVGVGGSYICQNFTAGKLTIASGDWQSPSGRGVSSCTNATISGGTFSGNSYGVYFCTNATISGGTFSGNSYGLNACSNATISGGTFSGNSYGVYFCTNATISGGTFSGNSYGLNACSNATISGGTFSGNAYGVYLCTNATISGGTFSGNSSGLNACSNATISGGTFSGNSSGLNACSNATISGGTFSGNTYALFYSSGKISRPTVFSGNTYDIRECGGLTLQNVTLTSSPEFYEYSLLTLPSYSESINHNNSSGAFKSWTAGGVTTSVSSPALSGFAAVKQIALESASLPGYHQKRVLVPAGKSVCMTFWLRKNASMAYLPRAWVFEDGYEPFLDATTILHTFTMSDSVDTWESEKYIFHNTDTYNKELMVRFIGMNASGYVYTALGVIFGQVSISGGVQ